MVPLQFVLKKDQIIYEVGKSKSCGYADKIFGFKYSGKSLIYWSTFSILFTLETITSEYSS